MQKNSGKKIGATAAEALVGDAQYLIAPVRTAADPKDVTALRHFGRNIAACLATNAPIRTLQPAHASS